MTPERQLINKALWAFRPTTEEGRTVRDLVLLCERLLGERTKPAAGDGSEESALRAEIDDVGTTALLVWADRLEEGGEDATVCDSLRDLARKGKRPGRVGDAFRWSAEKPEFGGGASWTLPHEVVMVLATRSTHLGGKEKGRFPSVSAGMLAAARVLAGKGIELPADAPTPSVGRPLDDLKHHPVKDADVHEGYCACIAPCACPRRVCHNCRRVKRDA